MFTSSTPSTPRQLASDPVADVVQLYLNVGEEGISREYVPVSVNSLRLRLTPSGCTQGTGGCWPLQPLRLSHTSTLSQVIAAKPET